MTTEQTTPHRAELYAKLKESVRARDDARARAQRRTLDTGALLEALVMDGASLREIGTVLEISHTAVDKILQRYRTALAKGAGEA